MGSPKGNGPPVQFEFDDMGLRIGSVQLVYKTTIGFCALSADKLAPLLDDRIDRSTNLPWLEEGLARVARAMNAGDFSLAAITATQLSLRGPGTSRGPDRVSKAAVDDPKHPGYPGGAANHEGGEFRPLDGSSDTMARVRDKAERLAKRRAVRSVLKRVLSTKRLLRLLAENAVAALTEEIPGLDAVVTGAALEDDLALLKDLASGLDGTDAAVTLAEKAPVDLKDLQVNTKDMPPDMTFNSFDAFKKIDLEKQFGAAGDGLDYHHLVEQGPNSGTIPQVDLQSPNNIVKLPRLLHEEVNSHYATPQNLYGNLVKPREFLRGKSFEIQKRYGIETLRQMGALQ